MEFGLEVSEGSISVLIMDFFFYVGCSYLHLLANLEGHPKYESSVLPVFKPRCHHLAELNLTQSIICVINMLIQEGMQ